MLQLGLGLELGTGNGYFIAFFFFPCLKVTNTFVLPSWPWVSQDPRTPVGNTGHPSILADLVTQQKCQYTHSKPLLVLPPHTLTDTHAQETRTPSTDHALQDRTLSL